MSCRITEKGVANYLEKITKIECTTTNELVEVLCVIATCMLHDLNNVNIKLLTTAADYYERDGKKTDSTPML